MNVLKKIYCRVFQIGLRISLPVLPYRVPKILNRVDSILSVLNQKHISHVLLVTDKNLRNLKLTEPLEKLLDENNIKTIICDDVQENPTVGNVLAGFELYKKNHCEAIIAFGGGSPIDCAKAIGAKVARPKLAIKKMNGILKILKRTPLFFAIPTTAGTGSETTLAAIITDENTHQKYTINDFPLIPDYAVLDYSLTVNLPPFVTAGTGMDVLVHIVEAFIGRSTTKYTRKMCLKAIKLFHDNILLVYTDPQNVKARKAMQKAAYYAGIAFTRSYVGYVHAISHPISGKYHVPHGLANAIILPYLFEEYGPLIDKKLAKLARAIGLCDKTLALSAQADLFKQWVQNVSEQLSIPTYIKEVKAEDIPLLAQYADIEANPLYPVPKLFGRKELEKIIEKLQGN